MGHKCSKNRTTKYVKLRLFIVKLAAVLPNRTPKFYMNQMLRAFLLLATTLGISTVVAGQSRIDYLDPQFNVVNDSLHSKFIRNVETIADTTYNVKIVYRTGELMMTGVFKDSNLQVEHGDFVYYYANGVVESQGKYKNGNKVGVWKRWSYDGSAKPDRQYQDENFKRSNRSTSSPKFPGGMDALVKLVNDSLRYPEEARDRQIEGTVYVTFMIDAAGDVRQAEVSEGVHYLLDEEALRFISTLPTWTPATRNGLPVESSFIMPVTFSLARMTAPSSTNSASAPPKTTN